MAANQSQIDEIDRLDPTHVNGTLNVQRAELVMANSDLGVFMAELQAHPTLVVAKNLSSMYMKTADKGTMIKVPGGDYIVSPANSQGPFIVKVSKRPASPAEGTLYADFAGTLASPVKGTKQIHVLGDGSAIEVGDLMLCFRDSTGEYYTPGGGGTGTVGMAQVITNSADKDNVPVGIWLTGDFSGPADITTTAKMPALASPYKVPAGTWAVAARLGDQWVLQVPLVTSYVP